jgi:CDGSH-type Zn-finger protein
MMIMQENMKTKSNVSDNSMKITVIKNGPYIAIGGVPLIISEIRNDEEGYRRSWREVKRYPVQEQYALCRCGHSDNKVFCDGTHAKIHFDGTEAGDYEPYIGSAKVIPGSMLTLLTINTSVSTLDSACGKRVSGTLFDNPKIQRLRTLPLRKHAIALQVGW